MNQLRTHSTIISILLILALFSSCSNEIYESGWQSKIIVVDGKAREWSKPLRYYDPPSKLAYTISNDSKNLYLCIRATDDITQTKILKGGLQIWLDTTGNCKQKIGILYPMPDLNTKSEDLPNPHTGTYPDGRTHKNQVQHDLHGMELTGFKAPIGGPTPLVNVYGIAVDLQMDSLDILTYEAKIPFSTFYHDSLAGNDTTRLLGINLVINGVPTAAKSAKEESAAGDIGSGGMGGPGMGARSGRGGPRTITPVNPLFESHTIKRRIRLHGPVRH